MQPGPKLTLNFDVVNPHQRYLTANLGPDCVTFYDNIGCKGIVNILGWLV